MEVIAILSDGLELVYDTDNIHEFSIERHDTGSVCLGITFKATSDMNKQIFWRKITTGAKMPQPLQKPAIPPSSDMYLWWVAGAEENQRENDRDVSEAGKEIRDVAAALARQHDADTREDIVLMLARIWCPDKLRRRHRTGSHRRFRLFVIERT